MTNLSDTSATTVNSFGITYTERYVQFGVYITCGSLSALGNCLMALGVVKTQQLRSRFYVIIVSLLICRVLMSFQLIALTTYRFLKILDVVVYPSRLICAAMALMIYPGTLELLLLLALAMDRAVALFAVSYYRVLTWHHAAKMCGVIALVPLALKVALLFGDPPLLSIVSCFSIFEAVAEENIFVSQNLDLALLIVLLIVYLLILIVIRLRLGKLRPSNVAALGAVKRHMVLMPTVRNIVVVHCAWTLTAKLLLTIGIMPFAERYSGRLLLYAGFFVASELLVNVVILLCTNSDIRNATLRLVMRA